MLQERPPAARSACAAARDATLGVRRAATLAPRAAGEAGEWPAAQGRLVLLLPAQSNEEDEGEDPEEEADRCEDGEVQPAEGSDGGLSIALCRACTPRTARPLQERLEVVPRGHLRPRPHQGAGLRLDAHDCEEERAQLAVVGGGLAHIVSHHQAFRTPAAVACVQGEAQRPGAHLLQRGGVASEEARAEAHAEAREHGGEGGGCANRAHVPDARGAEHDAREDGAQICEGHVGLGDVRVGQGEGEHVQAEGHEVHNCAGAEVGGHAQPRGGLTPEAEAVSLEHAHCREGHVEAEGAHDERVHRRHAVQLVRHLRLGEERSHHGQARRPAQLRGQGLGCVQALPGVAVHARGQLCAKAHSPPALDGERPLVVAHGAQGHGLGIAWPIGVEGVPVAPDLAQGLDLHPITPRW
mmetsp:Transcript_3888/g.11506  ORF Transcript_3888/g.11506 Transcript_3888/m.11506 type:complete len:411 (-) Transcript_3888:539-1771(-)